MSDRKKPDQKSDYRWWLEIPTRWMDNDVYGHVNNVHYYSYFDTIANTYLIKHAGLDIHFGAKVAYIVNSSCDYFKAIAFPDTLLGGLRVNRLGNSSVEWGIAIFKQQSDVACAQGVFTHVFVDRLSEKPVKIDGQFRNALEALLK